MASGKIDRQAHVVRALNLANGSVQGGSTFSVAPYMDADYLVLYSRRGGYLNSITILPWQISQGVASNITMYTFVGLEWEFSKDAIIRFSVAADGTFTVSENAGLPVYIDLLAIYF